jgi:uncharacterized protein YbjT (DUF2867 family)
MPSIAESPSRAAVRRAPRVLLTGATGFVGRYLYPALRHHGYRVVCGTRDPEKAQSMYPGRDFRRLDSTDAESVEAAMQGCSAAFYLIHSMAGGRGYEDVERESATNFRDAAERANLSRIIYLGGIRPRGRASRHLHSRLRTGEILRSGMVPTLELQASMIIGGGSESWRMVRDLAARLPIMLLPRWLDTLSQPIAIDDVTFALVKALEVPLASSEALTLPGPEVISAREIILRTAHLLGNRPKAIRVPFVTARLSAYWIAWVTRADPRISEELVKGLRSDLVASDEGFWRLAPEHERLPFDAAARAALLEEQRDLSLKSRLAERAIQTFSFGSMKTASRRGR